ncbi:MAG: glycosyltransferase family 4 protein [Nostoc sp.]|uniref:glycosyltransferase family 4 protein n=1 Tax=Nostoc sp. TaxID=1180 RepID=UPI002FF77FF4
MQSLIQSVFQSNVGQNKNKFTVAQLGARRHYSTPRILYETGHLEHFYTDICAIKGFPKYLRLIPPKFQSNSLARLTGRIPYGIDPNLITAFSGFGFEYISRLRKASSASETIKTFLWAGKTFGRLVLRQGIRGNGVYVFNTAGLELLQAAKQAGLKTVMEQTIAPYQIEKQFLQEEQALHPSWEEPLEKNEYLAEYIEREEQEWSLADVILCGSDFVRDSIQQCQGPKERCVIVPYGIDASFGIDTSFQLSAKTPHQGLLRVLTIGSVGLRKGIPYVLEAAKQLKGKAIFRVVGPVQVLPDAVAALQENLELVGQVARSQIMPHYNWADVFLLPSICEGSAAVTYEALACGLPVIATPNTGSIVEDGINGFIVPIRDVDAIVTKLESFCTQPELLVTMSKMALEKSQSLGSVWLGSTTSANGNEREQVLPILE